MYLSQSARTGLPKGSICTMGYPAVVRRGEKRSRMWAFLTGRLTALSPFGFLKHFLSEKEH